MARTATASLVARLSHKFSNQARRDGYCYSASGRVRIRQGNDNKLSARVQGDERYDVLLERVGDTLNVSCTCAATRSSEPCKHIWASIIQADNHLYLRGPGKDLPMQMRLEQPVVNDDFEDEEADDEYHAQWEDDEDEWRDSPRREPERRPASQPQPPTPGSRFAPPPAPVPAWRKHFEAIRTTVLQAEAKRSPYADRWPATRQMLYIVDLTSIAQSAGIVLEIHTRDRKMNGDWSKPKLLKISTSEVRRIPDATDRQVLCTLLGASTTSYYYRFDYYGNSTCRFVLPIPITSSILEMVCGTGRCMMRLPNEPDELRPITWDTESAWELVLELRRDGNNYVFSALVERNGTRMPLRRPFMYLVDKWLFMEDRVARLEHFGAIGWLRFLASQERLVVPAPDGAALVAELLALPKIPKLDLPEELRFEDCSVAPRPCLTVRRPRKGSWDGSRLLGQLSFQYGDLLIPNDDARSILVQAEKRVLVRRDTAAEAAALDELRRLGFKPAYSWIDEEGSLELAAKRLPRVVPELIAAGWHVEAEGKLYRQPGDINIEVTSGIDWFELHGSVSYGDSTASLPKLLMAIKKGQSTIELSDGTLGMLPEEWLKKYGVLAGLGSAKGDHLRFTRSQAGLLDALLLSQPKATCDAVFARVRDELKQFGGIQAIATPPEFSGTLRAYQRDGLGWMQFLQRFGFGGCLADDMGLGKTVQVLALLESRRVLRVGRDGRPAESAGTAAGNGRASDAAAVGGPRTLPAQQRPGPSLVVVPKSLVFNWKQEAARFTPLLRVLDHTGSDRTKGTEHFDDYDVILTTYGTLRRDAMDFKDARFDYVILDEAQAIKNADTESAKAARLLSGNHRLALSGTPIENHLGELWSLFEFLNPGMLGAASVLRLGGAGARNPAVETRELLARALRPFILRRTKEQVAKDLPPKTEQTIFCELEAAQRKLYNELRDHYRNSLLARVARDGINKSKIQILEALLRLRQAACHPGLIDKNRTAEPCAKLDVLIPQLVEVLEEDHKVLVFSQFTSLLAIVRDRLDAEKIPYEYLDGKTRDREACVHRFQTDPDCKLFLISLKAGGLGLNLTAAEYVFLLDPWWNPAVETQAIDRTHRIGQTRHVFAYRLIARDTVEEKVLALQATKRDLADAIINADNSLIRNIAREDLELLLS